MLNDLLSLISLYQIDWSWPTITPETAGAVVLLAAFCMFTSLEIQAPFHKVSRQLLRQSYSANLSLFLFNSVVMSLLSASMLWIVAKQQFSFGLLHAVPNPAEKAVISFLLLDLLLYGWHWVCHRYDNLWRFHKVHHNDPYLNVSTGFRVHISELFMTYILKIALIVLMGIDASVVLINEIMTTVFIMFHHTNSAFRGERWFGLVFTTPSLHRTHHSVERKEHDNNYGAVLSIWDRLFGTLLDREPVKVGIDGYSPMDFINLVKFGFVDRMPVPVVPVAVDLDHMIAEAAYYKAEKRNFMPGHEWDDWLEAKREILQSLCGDRKKWTDRVGSKQNREVNWFNQLFGNLDGDGLWQNCP